MSRDPTLIEDTAALFATIANDPTAALKEQDAAGWSGQLGELLTDIRNAGRAGAIHPNTSAFLERLGEAALDAVGGSEE